MNEQTTSPSAPRKRSRGRRLLIGAFVVLALVGALIVGLAVAARPEKLAEVPLADGRTLQIEGITFGVEHRVGKDSPFKRFAPWIPGALRKFAITDRGEDRITLERPGLVVWVNAIDSTGRTNVDCQKIRVEFVDKNGDLFGEHTRSWFGSQTFWRAGHVFYCYPREERELTLRVTTWKDGKTCTAKILNPSPATPAQWTGDSLPQTKRAGKQELQLASLTVRTNGQGRYYETPARYFEPVFKLFEHGEPATGWSAPEWSAESPGGNHGQFLGVHQPVLRFTALMYPEATNEGVAQLIATLPRTDLSALVTNQIWSRTNVCGSNAVVVLGLFPRGTHTFSEGLYESSSPTVNGPGGGAPSGWTWGSRPITPFREKSYGNHYTPVPVIYVKWCQMTPSSNGPVEGDTAGTSERLALRLRDEHGGKWVAKPESWNDGIQPFLLELPPGVTNVVPELVLLKPVTAEFMVNTKSLAAP